MGEGALPGSVPERRHLPSLFFEQVCLFFYSRFILLLSLFYTDPLVSIIHFNYDYWNSTTILFCLCFYSLYYHYHFVNLNFICSNNNLYIRLPFQFTYDTDKKIRDFEIYLSIISNEVILMLLFPQIFKWFFLCIYIYIYVYIYVYIYNIYISFIYHIYTYIYVHIHTYTYILYVITKMILKENTVCLKFHCSFLRLVV